MRARSERRLEEMLRTGAGRARRDPSPGLRSNVRAAIDASGSEVHGEPVAGSFAGLPSRERRRAMSVAAAMLVALGFGLFAAVRSDGPSSSSIGSARKERIPAVRDLASPEPVARLALACQRTLRTAVDDPLRTELAGIAEDATRTIRFLAGRVPASLIRRNAESAGR